MKSKRTLLLLSLLMSGDSVSSAQYHMESPDGRLDASFWLNADGEVLYSLDFETKPVLLNSKLGFVFKNEPALESGFVVDAVRTSSRKETWTQPWGESRSVLDHYNQMEIHLKEPSGEERSMQLHVRLYDDGLAYRFVWPEQENLAAFAITDEKSEFVLAGDHDCWWIPAMEEGRYEYLYQKSRLSELSKSRQTVHTPLTMKAREGFYIVIHEAALTDYASMTLRAGEEHQLECELVPWSDGIKVRASTPHRTPWRTIQVSDRLSEILDSHLALNLNEPSRIEDTSWIEPGKYVGIWWGMHLRMFTWYPSEASGLRQGLGATTKNTKEYIDFAAKHGFDGVLVEGWNQGWHAGGWTRHADAFNFTEANDAYDLEWLSHYAHEQGTRLVMHHETGGSVENYERQAEAAFALCEKHGIRVCKTGYVVENPGIKRYDENGDFVGMEFNHGQYMVRHYRRIVELAARHRVNLIVHEPIKDTGIRRTWPNMMTREGARGQEYNAWDPQGGNPPDHTVILPFTRMLSGPMDFTPGVFDLLFDQYRPNNRINTTLAKQLALYVVLYSPLHMATDLPRNYEGHPCFQFILDVPTDWERSVSLNGEIGEYITVARQKRDSGEWFVGSITNESERTLHIDLSFLDSGRLYLAEVYADGPNTHWEFDPMSFDIRKGLVKPDMEISIKLAAGGGQAIRLQPITPAEALNHDFLE